MAEQKTEKTNVTLSYEAPLDGLGEVIGQRVVQLQVPSGITYRDLAYLVRAEKASIDILGANGKHLSSSFIDGKPGNYNDVVEEGSCLRTRNPSLHRDIENYLGGKGYPVPHEKDQHNFKGKVHYSTLRGGDLCLMVNDENFELPNTHARVDVGEVVTLYSIMGFGHSGRFPPIADAASIEGKFNIITPGNVGKIYRPNRKPF